MRRIINSSVVSDTNVIMYSNITCRQLPFRKQQPLSLEFASGYLVTKLFCAGLFLSFSSVESPVELLASFLSSNSEQSETSEDSWRFDGESFSMMDVFLFGSTLILVLTILDAITEWHWHSIVMQRKPVVTNTWLEMDYWLLPSLLSLFWFFNYVIRSSVTLFFVPFTWHGYVEGYYLVYSSLAQDVSEFIIIPHWVLFQFSLSRIFLKDINPDNNYDNVVINLHHFSSI